MQQELRWDLIAQPVTGSSVTARRCDDLELGWYDCRQGLAVPLSLAQVRPVVTRLGEAANHQGISACMIGGCAVMAHLAKHRFRGAPARSSLDIDVVATAAVTGFARRGRLMSGGWALSFPLAHGHAISVDWIVRGDRWRKLFGHAIAQATDLGFGLPVADGNHLVAMKAILPAPALRAKDVRDIQLLLESGAASISGALDVVASCLAGALPLARESLKRAEAA